ncbi:ABC transporter C family member 5 [Phytophthora cinnamomi]|uniref:ABC transporter C family member 5 n=1 Tax=Phytophthora cinnamomi TaxID=4785 RepID=UPI003559E12C|nr:ABC transporter C family member 5 [Phytophthora cinnamomi]
MQLGAQRQLTDDDLWELEPANRTETAFADFTKHFEESGGSLFRAVVRSYGGKLVVCGAASLVSAACGLLAPVVLHHVIETFAAPTIDLNDLSVWLGLFFASRLANALVSAHLAYYLDVLGLRLTAALKALLFQKTLRRITAKASSGEAVDISNLFTSDANSVSTVAHYINSAWILPIQIGVVVYMLYWVIGAAAFAGLGVIGASTLAGMLVGKVSVDKFREMMQQRDDRMKAIKEVFGAIQFVKLNAWENKFAERISDRRRTEMTALQSFLLTCSLEELVVWASPLMISIFSLAVYSVGMGQPLTAAKVFTALVLFNALRTPLQDLPSVIQACLHSKVALDRITDYLSHADYNASNVLKEDPTQAKDVVVSVENGSFGWNANTPVLTNVNIKIKRGDLAVIWSNFQTEMPLKSDTRASICLEGRKPV